MIWKIYDDNHHNMFMMIQNGIILLHQENGLENYDKLLSLDQEIALGSRLLINEPCEVLNLE